MKALFRILFPASMLLPFALRAQEDRLHGTVLDSLTGKPLQHVHVVAEGRPSTTTDRPGQFSFPWNADDRLRLRLTLTGYAERTVVVERAAAEKESVRLLLVPDIDELGTVVVRPGPQVVYQRTDLHVGAFHVNDDGLWVLAYDRPGLWHRQEDAGQQVLKNARLYLLDTLFQERAYIAIPGPVLALRHDHARRPIVEGAKEAWVAWSSGDSIVLATLSKETLHTAVLPWTDSIPGRLLGNNLTATYPAFEHIAYDPAHDELRTICSVEDAHLVQLFRSQYKYMSGRDKVIAMDLEKETGIDREIHAGYMTAFHTDILYKVPYAPLFVVRDTLCVFDRYKGAIRRFTTALVPEGEVPFAEGKGRDRWSHLVQDPASGTVYSVYEQGVHTWLRSVDVSTGAFGTITMLSHPFPEELQVHGGYAYYVYRTYGSLQRRTLYREALR